MISVVNLSLVLVGLYCIYFLLQRRKNFLLFLVIIILFIPKISLISIGVISTGIRADDVLIALAFLYILLTKKITSNIVLNRFVKLLMFVCLSNLCSVFFGIFFLGNSNILWTMLVLIRKIEYFILIYIGYFSFSKMSQEEKYNTLYRELSILECALFLIALLQILGLCGYAIKGEIRDTFSNAAVATFNGYYEYALFLSFSNIYYFFAINNRKYRMFSVLMFLTTLVFIYFSTSRTSFIVTCVIDFILLCKSIVRVPRKKVAVTIGILFLLIPIGAYFLLGSTLLSDSRFSSVTISGMWQTLTENWKIASFEEYLLYFKYGKHLNLYIASGGDLSAALRFYKWGAVFKEFLKYPLFGYGFGRSNVIDGNYIRLLGETGIIGTFLWLFLLGSVLKYEKKNKDFLSKICFYSVIALLLNSIFIDSFDSSKVMEFLWFLIGCSVMNERNFMKDGKNSSNEKNTNNNPSCSR